MSLFRSACIIGLDPGATTGWALLRGDGSRVRSGTWKLSQPGFVHGARFYEFRQHLSLLLTDARATAGESPVVVGYELPFVMIPKGGDPDAIRGRMASIRDLMGYCALIEEECYRRKVEAWPYEFSTIKKRAGGGRLDKQALQIAAGQVWPCPADRPLYTTDEADSLWTAECARHALGMKMGTLV